MSRQFRHKFSPVMRFNFRAKEVGNEIGWVEDLAGKVQGVSSRSKRESLLHY